MTKCTLCVDRIYNEDLAPQDRRPACVMACPTSARLFGDVHDPESEVSTAIRERGGYQLMPEWGTAPANHYLPRRKVEIKLRDDEVMRPDSPKKLDAPAPPPGTQRSTLDDAANFSG